MIPSSFSLTQQWIITPALCFRAKQPQDLQNTMQRWNISAAKDVIQKEVIARVIAAFASVAAAADACFHLFAAGYKQAILSLNKSYDVRVCQREVQEHLARAKMFATATLTASLKGLLNPESLKEFIYTPTDYFPITETNYPEHIKRLLRTIANPHCDLNSCLQKAKALLSSDNLEDKRMLSTILSSYNSPRFNWMRQQLAGIAFSTIEQVNPENPSWPSYNEIAHFLEERVYQQLNHAFYFHATSEENLLSILTTSKLEVRHEKRFCGAFVSTQPEKDFGKCHLVFHKYIERLSDINHAFNSESGSFWAGFTNNIPVTKNTLACILFEGGERECRFLQKRCKKAYGKDIVVLPIHDVEPMLKTIKDLGQGIPKEWREKGALLTPNAILSALRPQAAGPLPFQRMAVAV
jgi:hypothetical protein